MISNTQGRKFAGSRLLRNSLAGLVLILLLGSSMEAAGSAGSQQTEPAFTFTLYARELQQKGHVCLGENINILARVLMSHEPNPNRVRLEYVSGFPVTALVSGGTGTMTSDKAWLGMDLDVPEASAFTFEPTQAGHEKISFETVVPSSISLASVDTQVSGSLEFDVKKCKYRMDLIHDFRPSAAASRERRLGVIENATIEQGDDGVYRGSANFEMDFFDVPVSGVDSSCVGEPSTIVSSADITGTSAGATLNLTITYEDVEYTRVSNCSPAGSTTLSFSPTHATLSISGGSVLVSESLPASRMTVRVMLLPVE